MVASNSRWLVDTSIAHRGFHSGDHNFPENSLIAFERAKVRGFAIELDVKILSDGKVAVFHDESIWRMTGLDREISGLDSLQMKQLRLLESDQHVPLLLEVLDLVRNEVPLLIEIKNFGRARKLEEALASVLMSYSGPYAVQSFNPFSLKWFKVNAAYIERGQIAGDFRDIRLPFFIKLPLRQLLLNGVSRPTFINYDIRCLPNRAVERAQRKGLPILGWTATTLNDYQAALNWCDNVIFEGFDPTQAIQV